VVTSGNKIAAKLGTCLVAKFFCCCLHWYLLALAEADMVEVNITAVDWLANFSDYKVTIKLRQSYEVVKSAFKIWIQRFHDNLMTS